MNLTGLRRLIASITFPEVFEQLDRTEIMLLQKNRIISNLNSEITELKDGKKKVSAKKPVEKYNKEGRLLETYKSISEAASALEFFEYTIKKACDGEIKTAGGFVWKYKTGGLK